MPTGPTYDRKNVLVGLAAMYFQPYISTTPPTLPPDTTALWTAWSSPWTPIGATTEGLTFGFQRQTNNIMIEEQATPVDVQTTMINFTMQVTLSEDTLETMLLAYGGGTTSVVAAGTGQPATKTLQIGSGLTYFSFGFEGKNNKGFWRRVLVPVVVSVAEAQTVYRRAESQRTYGVTLTSLVAPEEVIIKEMTAIATP
jgi:hypothetical protein